jgi:hypothetical protein
MKLRANIDIADSKLLRDLETECYCRKNWFALKKEKKCCRLQNKDGMKY